MSLITKIYFLSLKLWELFGGSVGLENICRMRSFQPKWHICSILKSLWNLEHSTNSYISMQRKLWQFNMIAQDKSQISELLLEQQVSGSSRTGIIPFFSYSYKIMFQPSYTVFFKPDNVSTENGMRNCWISAQFPFMCSKKKLYSHYLS